MKRLILITGLLVALLGLIRSVDAITVGYGSTGGKKIRMINLDDGTIMSSAFDDNIYDAPLQGLAIDTSAEFLYGSDQNGKLYKIDIDTGDVVDTVNMDLNNDGRQDIEDAVLGLDFGGLFGTQLLATNVPLGFPSTTKIYNIDPGTGSSTLKKESVPISGAVRAMAVNTINTVTDPFPFETKEVWIANDDNISDGIMDFQSFNLNNGNVDFIGNFDDPFVNPDFFEPLFTGKIQGMDRIDGMLYGLTELGGIYSIDQASGLLAKLGVTDDVWLGLATSELSGSSSNTDPVPEAPTVALLGIGLAGLAGGTIRRRMKNRRIETQPSFV